MIENFHVAKIQNNEKNDNGEEKTEYGAENTYYDTAPILVLEEKKADVSYTREGVLFKRSADIYRDQNGNAWFEVTKSPRKQMMISLLSQPFFNVATIVEIPKKETSISRFFSKINERLASVFKQSPKFISKGLNLDKVEQKTYYQMIADYMVFESIFDRGNGDRNFTKKHNVLRRGSGYSLFDFDLSGITPLKHFKESKAPQGFMSRSPDDGMKDYFLKVKDIISGGSDRNPYWLRTDVPFALIENTVKKLKEIKEFYSKEDSEQFMQAVLNKTKYEIEYRNEFKKAAKNRTFDESYLNAAELTKGLLAQVSYSANVLLDELQKEKGRYLEKTDDKKDASLKYENMLSELTSIVNPDL